jgi:hypothetical protein
MKFANFIPVLAAISSPLWWWWLSQAPSNYWVIFLAVIIFNLLAAIIVNRGASKRGWNFALLPLLSQLVVLGYAIIVSSQVLISFLLTGLVIFLYIYWRYVYFYLHRPQRYPSFSLEQLSFYINYLLIFLLGALAFGLRSFLNYNLGILAGGVAIITALVLYQIMWVSKADWQKFRWYLLIYLAIMMETFWALSFLPLNHNLLGFLWASVYYFFSVMLNDSLNHQLAGKRVRVYLILITIGWVVLLLSARWL